jgi:hypothetical protein
VGNAPLGLALELGQQLFDRQAERLQLLLLDPQGGGTAVIAFDQQTERALARLTNRLGLQARGRPEGVLGVKHRC